MLEKQMIRTDKGLVKQKNSGQLISVLETVAFFFSFHVRESQ